MQLIKLDETKNQAPARKKSREQPQLQAKQQQQHP